MSVRQKEISRNLAVREENGESFILGGPDEVYVDEDAGEGQGRGMVKIRQEDVQGLVDALQTMLLAPKD